MKNRVILKILSLVFSIIIIGCVNEKKETITEIKTNEELISNIDSLIALKNYSYAMNLVFELLEKDSNNTKTYVLKGEIEALLEQDSLAMISFNKALSFDNQNYYAYTHRAKLKIKLEDFKSAISDCNIALRIDDKNPKAYILKGEAYELLNDNINAITQYHNGIKNGNISGEIYYKLGCLYIKEGDNEKGCENLSKAGELGYMNAYNLIKINCNNKSIQKKINTDFNGKYYNFENRFSIKFPTNWQIKAESPSENKELNGFTVWGYKNDKHIIAIMEFDNSNITTKSIFNLDVNEWFIDPIKNEYIDFNIIDTCRTSINNVDTYFLKFSHRELVLNKNLDFKDQKYVLKYELLSFIQNPLTKKIYILSNQADNSNIHEFESIYYNVINTFKFLN